MSDSSSACVEIKEVDVDDMELIMKYLYGTLICVPEERLHSLLLAADRFEVHTFISCILAELATMTQNFCPAFICLMTVQERVAFRHKHLPVGWVNPSALESTVCLYFNIGA